MSFGRHTTSQSKRKNFEIFCWRKSQCARIIHQFPTRSNQDSLTLTVDERQGERKHPIALVKAIEPIWHSDDIKICINFSFCPSYCYGRLVWMWCARLFTMTNKTAWHRRGKNEMTMGRGRFRWNAMWNKNSTMETGCATIWRWWWWRCGFCKNVIK